MFRSLLFAFAVTAAAACAPTTHIVAQWKNPDITPSVVQRPLVVFQHESEALRRSVEDALAKRVPGAVPAYRVLSTDEIKDVDKVKQKVRDAGYDTVIIAHLVDVNRQVNVIPGPPGPLYGPLWGYWASGWDTAYGPTVDTTTVVTLETLVYTLDPRFGNGEGELVFATRSETFDPRTVGDLAEAVVRASVTAMEKQGFMVLAAEPRSGM